MAQKDNREPKGDRNRIVIEGIDEPKKKKKTAPAAPEFTQHQVDVDRELFPKVHRRGRYSDRMRISPFKQGYFTRKRAGKKSRA